MMLMDKEDMCALETVRKLAKKEEAERALLFGYMQGLEAGAQLLRKEEEKKTA